MSPIHILLALLVALAWALNFVVVSVGLHSVPPFLLLAIRFALCALPILVLPRPTIPWPRFVVIGANLFILQFGLLFLGMANGMSAGMSSVILQAQTIFTPVVAALVLAERPTARQIAGISLSVVGMGIVATTVSSGGITTIGVVLILAAAFSWSVANIQLRSVGKQNMLALMAWMSLVPPLPFFVLSLLFEGGPSEMSHLVTGLGWREIGLILYITVISTYVGHGGWAYLLKHYTPTTVAPFSLLVPVLAAASSSVLLGEQFGPARLWGMGFVLLGLAVIAIPLARPAPLVLKAEMEGGP